MSVDLLQNTFFYPNSMFHNNSTEKKARDKRKSSKTHRMKNILKWWISKFQEIANESQQESIRIATETRNPNEKTERVKKHTRESIYKIQSNPIQSVVEQTFFGRNECRPIFKDQDLIRE